MTKTELLTGKPFLHVTSDPTFKQHFRYCAATEDIAYEHITERTITCIYCYTVLYVTNEYFCVQTSVLDQPVVVRLPLSEYVLIGE